MALLKISSLLFLEHLVGDAAGLVLGDDVVDHGVGLLLDGGGRELEVHAGDEFLDDLVAGGAVGLRFLVEGEVFADARFQVLEVELGDLLREGVVDGGGDLDFDFLELDLVLRLLAGDGRLGEVGGEVDLDGALLALVQADDLLGEFREETVGAHPEPKVGIVGEVLRVGDELEERLAIERAGVGDDAEVAHGDGALGGVLEAGALVGERLEGLVNVGVGNVGVVLFQDEALVLGQLEVGDELDEGGEAEGEAGLVVDVLDLGRADDAHFLFADRLLVGLGDEGALRFAGDVLLEFL